ncbi:MAG: glycosyl transferase [Acidobacteria bacterium]|nr:glycosyl transferase [Acidobacteriota bacterium]
MRIAFCAHGVTPAVLQRTEFYRQDFEILQGLGHEVELVSHPLRLGAGYDLAFVWWWNYLWAWGPAAALRRLPVITTGVFDVTEFPGLPLWKRLLKASGVPASDLHLFVSRFEAERAPSLAPFDAGTIRVSPLVIDTEVYRPAEHPAESGPFIILNVAWQKLVNAKRKMLFELLEAFALLHAEAADTRLVLAGPPVDGGAALQQRARELGVDNAVDFPGELTLAEKIAAMQRCSLYVQVSRYEGFGMATAEAMACAKPVLVSNVGAVPEVVGDCGTYVDEISTEGIHRGLRALYARRDTLPELGRRARQRIERELSRPRRARDLARYLDEVMGTKDE